MKRVMMVEMYGKRLVVEQLPGAEYEFRVYNMPKPDLLRNKYHLASFESFQEALEFVTKELYS